MNFFKNKIAILFVVLSSLVFYSCEDNNDQNNFQPLFEARFISEVSASTVTFTNVSGNATSYSWDFGNGDTSTIINPEVTFQNGTYTVVLTAFDADGNSDIFEETFVIDC